MIGAAARTTADQAVRRAQRRGRRDRRWWRSGCCADPAPVHGTYVARSADRPASVSIGLGLGFVPLTSMATSGVPADDAGLASGLFITAQQVGGSLGLAILSTLAASQRSRLLSSHSATKVAATVSGYHVAFFAAALMMFGASVLLVVALRKRHLAEVEQAIESGEVTAVAAGDGGAPNHGGHGCTMRRHGNGGGRARRLRAERSATAGGCSRPRRSCPPSMGSRSARRISWRAPALAAGRCFATSRRRST